MVNVFCFISVIFFTNIAGSTLGVFISSSLNYWQLGFFSLLGFTLQMMMILVFGYALAVFKPVHDFLKIVAQISKNNFQAVVSTGIITMLAGLLNWGFGLIIGALVAKFIAVALEEKEVNANLPLFATSGYFGMAVWHGGLSGSASLKVAEKNHFLIEKIGVIPIQETIFSAFNIWVTGGLILVLLLASVFCEKHIMMPSHNVKSSPLKPIKGSTTLKLGGII